MARRVRRACVAAVIALGAAMSMPGGFRAGPVPVPDPGFLGVRGIGGSACVPTTQYENAEWTLLGNYGTACRRLHFVYGPLHVKAGQMDAVVEPVTIEKPAYSGYITRFRPDLVNANGSVPDITQVHLHHGTWLNGYPQYGSGPFFAAGEEKTIANFPLGYGMHVGASDTWLLLYMVHNQTPQPRIEYITYDVDFVADAAAAKLGITPVKPIWLDVQGHPVTSGAPNRSAYPVFNVQRGFGGPDPDPVNSGHPVCTWPRDNCSRFDSFSQQTPQQGRPVSLAGADWVVPSGLSGTLVGLGGHLHPGGVRDEVSLVRNGVATTIFKSEALAWSRAPNSSQAGGPRNTWDFSMTVTGAPLNWKVKIQPGDTLRLNAVYDNSVASWYENMGIVVAMVAPNDTHPPAGVDVFSPSTTLVDGLPTSFSNGSATAPLIPSGWNPPSCTASLGTAPVLCTRGMITHGHLAEASSFGGCITSTECGGLRAKQGRATQAIVASGFSYTNADLGNISTLGMPQVKLGKSLRFYNADTGAAIWHTFTLCSESTTARCDGATGLDYPLASGGSGSAGDVNDFDSSEVGYGNFFSSAKAQIPGQNPVQDGAYWDFKPTQQGVFQFFCRVHPSMRGAFQVVP